MNNILELRDFVSSFVPAAVAGRKTLRVLVATYSEVSRYKDGLVDTQDPSINIMVATGGQNADKLGWGFLLGWGAAIFNGDLGGAVAGSELVHAIASDDQGTVNEKIEGVSLDIALVYAGLSAFDEAIATATRLSRDYPTAQVVILTCNCSLREKLERLTREDGISAVVWTSECGGRGAMRDMIDAFIAAWPNRQVQ